jgi:hypothetical protein
MPCDFLYVPSLCAMISDVICYVHSKVYGVLLVVLVGEEAGDDREVPRGQSARAMRGSLSILFLNVQTSER